jgi:hypothetical protein
MMTMRRISRHAMLAATTVFLMAAAPADGWATYRNARFGFAACYPTTLFPEPESGSGDGRVFKARDGSELRTFGEFYYDDNSTMPARLKAEDKDLAESKATVTYRAQGRGWFVRSGTQGQRIFYHKVVQRGDQFLDLQFSYPAARAAQWSGAVAKMSRCFV